MNTDINESIWNQFGASIDMLENAIKLCPLEHWDTGTKFWYNAFHCLFFMDYYLTMDPKTYAPPLPFTLSEFEDVMPARTYTKDELLNYLDFCRNKAHALIYGLSVKELCNRWVNVSGSMNFSVLEILLYNMRHVQHHAAQLNLLLRQSINDSPEWVFSANVK